MRAAFLAALLLLVACSGKSSTGAPPGEDQQLDQAAASLDGNSPDGNTAEIVDADENGSRDNSP